MNDDPKAAPKAAPRAGRALTPIEPKPGDFECPICHSETYCFVLARREDGSSRPTSLMQCLGCSVTFTDFARFARPRRIVLKQNSWTTAEQPSYHPEPADGGPTDNYKQLPKERPRKPRGEGDGR